MKTHWLHGTGPNKEVKFNYEIDEETDCNQCIHNEVCMHRKDRLCINYEFGTSEYSGCDGCLHRFTRWDKKEPLPCFYCEHFLPK